ncbi:D-2-hydroxyacid dehydrogenase family protein [Aquibium sp. LZ166]|uniref:D-2-hydroxyacid dehydrogenase family protein n=1 Tax=Aquibium pacificus TaxID=3153579 RepID=A0ABV3SN94_9HYPH
MTKTSCAILDDYQDAARGAADWNRISGNVAIERFADHIADRAALAERLAKFEVIVAMRERTAFDDDLFSRLPNLKLLITTGMVNAAIDLDAAKRHGVMVCGTRGSVGPAAELAFGLLLSVMRNIPAESANFHAGGDQWQLSVGRDLNGKTLGVVGIGKLGQRVARYGQAFGMNVIGWSKNVTPERCEALGIGYAATLRDLLAGSDAVSLHLTLNAETRGIIGERELAAMKRDAVIVNTSRGPLVDEAALVAALRDGRLGGAGLDTFDQEPLPAGHPLRGMANVVATPHLGYVTAETYAIYYADAVEDIAAWLAGSPVRVLNA